MNEKEFLKKKSVWFFFTRYVYYTYATQYTFTCVYVYKYKVFFFLLIINSGKVLCQVTHARPTKNHRN